MTTKMSKQAQINYLTARVNQLENQLAAAQSKINSFVTFGIEPTDCVCGHEQSDHDAQGLHPCGQCICEEYYVIQR